jgi:proteasome accessory factor C
MTWRDLFELYVALAEARHLVSDPALDSVLTKLSDQLDGGIRVEHDEPSTLPQIRRAIERRERLKVVYWSPASDEPTERSIEPSQVASRAGHWYVRAWCLSRELWLTFRVDRIVAIQAASAATDERPVDSAETWIGDFADDGNLVVLTVPYAQRWLFETLPGAQFGSHPSAGEVVRVSVSDLSFLDRLLVAAGPGCSVLTPGYRDAGRGLARRIVSRL